MNDNIIVQFVGFQSKPRAREYTFTVREREEEPREYTITITNEAFDSRRVRYQDAPDVCSHKLHRELAGAENHPAENHFFLTNPGIGRIPRGPHQQDFEVSLRSETRPRSVVSSIQIARKSF